ncbi:UPF0715 family protein [Oceanobacillus kapialis]|uniref:UPF0715 family protein n=1 Tax=Oceanobacillus kapialis TaxID=481353 RepID=A0ABW5PVD5_9BACI
MINIIALLFVCLVGSSILSSLFYFLFLYTYFSFLAFIIVSIIYFLCYLFFAVPVQLWLRRRPKRFSVKHLLTYFSAAFFVIVILFLMHDNPDFASAFLLSSYHAFVFWLLDSIILKDKMLNIPS